MRSFYQLKKYIELLSLNTYIIFIIFFLFLEFSLYDILLSWIIFWIQWSTINSVQETLNCVQIIDVIHIQFKFYFRILIFKKLPLCSQIRRFPYRIKYSQFLLKLLLLKYINVIKYIKTVIYRIQESYFWNWKSF